MACLSSATVAFFATKTFVESKQKKDQCQNSINFKHITKLIFSFLFCYFLTQSRNKNNGFAYMRPKIKYFQKIIIFKKKKQKRKETENEREKGTDRREKRRVWGQRVWERRVEAVCGTGGTVRTTLMNSLRRRRLMSAWYYRYYSHCCCCYSDSLPLPLHWCFFCFCFALYFFKNQKNNQKKKKKQFLCSEILGQEQSLRVCLFVCLFVIWFLNFIFNWKSNGTKREIFWGFGMYVCFCFVLLLAFGNYGVEQPTVRLALLSKRSYTCAVKLLLYFTAPPASQVGFFFFFFIR